MKNVYTPNDFKHLESDAAMIQAAIDEAAKYGVSVIIPRYNERTDKCIWEIDKTLWLHDGSDVLLDNCHIRLMDDTYIHFFANDSASADKKWWRRETRQYDISLSGRGNALLDGGNHNNIFEKDFNIYDDNGKFVKKVEVKGFKGIYFNRGLCFRNVERIKVSGIRFINQRYWGMCFEFCSYGHVKDITFEALSNVPNQDGIDIRVGCNNFLVENITGKTGDDTIALTNFPVNEPDVDMDMNIHNVIIKNIHSELSSKCDIIRLLNRGGTEIYNVQIANVVDISEEYGENRALAAIRIGDLNDYPARLNSPGEIRNITVRDVVTRARFGVYVANSLTDSVFENIMMTSDGGIGMYFNGCIMKNIFVDKLLYNVKAAAPVTDVGYRHVHHRVNIDYLSAIHFNNSTGDNINVNNIVGAENLTYIFGGNSNIKIKASNIVAGDRATKLADAPEII